jgi:hypothetical protein
VAHGADSQALPARRLRVSGGVACPGRVGRARAGRIGADRFAREQSCGKSRCKHLYAEPDERHPGTRVVREDASPPHCAKLAPRGADLLNEKDKELAAVREAVIQRAELLNERDKGLYAKPPPSAFYGFKSWNAL